MAEGVNWNQDEIHLIDYYLPQLSDTPSCPTLMKLFLQAPCLAFIHPNFFEHMPLLQVLDLSNTNIVSLPPSISSLKSLREFFLRDCSALMELPTQIGMLSELKLFDIKGTELMFIPKEMGKLINLEVLRFSLSQFAKDYIKTSVNETVIPRKMLSKLKKLKELCVTISVGPEPEWWEEEVKYLQKELRDLENLETLRWYLPTAEVLQQFLLLEINHVPIYTNLSDLMLTVGQHAQLTSCLPQGLEKKFEEFKNCLKWINAEGSIDDISKIMASAKALLLSRHWTIEKLSTFNVTQLKYCLLVECNEMKAIVEAPEDAEPRTKNGEKVGFELLQYLSVHYMNKLQSIWKGPIGKDSLSKLRILALHTCPQLTLIFTPTIAQNLSCLTEITVEHCPKVKSLITNESHNAKHGMFFPSLERIFLLYLPELVNIFVGEVMLEKLQTMLIYNCLQLRDLSNMELPHIKKIEGENEWWNGLGYDTSRWENVFVPLKKKRDLVEQLFEVTNSLEHFHDISQGYDEMKLSNLTDIKDQVTKADASMGKGKGKGLFFPPEGHDEKKLSNLTDIKDQVTTADTSTGKGKGKGLFFPPKGYDEKKLPNFTNIKDRVTNSRSISSSLPIWTDPYFQLGGPTLSVLDHMRSKIEGNKVKGTLVWRERETTFKKVFGQHVSLQLVSSTRSESFEGRQFWGRSEKRVSLVGTPSTKGYSTLELEFSWDDEDGVPGAILITNYYPEEFYLKTLTLTHVPNVGRLHFVCNSWVYSSKHYNLQFRVFFSNQTYLPAKTPEILRIYRHRELEELRGDGKGKRDEWDRVYDYDVYNDLSEPDKGSELVRPVFGGSIDRPYPRRCRTGRAATNTDPNMESRIGILHSSQIYVPRDETFSDLKIHEVYANGLKLVSQGSLPGFESSLDQISDKIVGATENAIHHNFESVSTNDFNEFDTFDDVLKLYYGGHKVPKFNFVESVGEKMPGFSKGLFHSDGQHLAEFPVPQVIKEDKYAWMTDEEFGRELLAGICPVVIKCLREFPPTSKLDPMKFGNQHSTITSDHVEDQMDGFSLVEALNNKRLFILDHHDSLMPYLRRINETPTKTYATRTILFLQNNGTLKPIAIELSLPHPDGDEAGIISTVHTPASHGAQGTIWLLAKAYAKVNDSGYHQLVCHWLHTHASVEPFIIATNRQLSVLHPIHKLLHPHFRDTMNINALYRQMLISAGGIFEKTIFLNKYSLAMSSNMYKSWNFTKQALPADLIDRGMAVEDSTSPHGVRLLIEDYPFAVDGLEIWSAIKSWVLEYVFIYYKNDEEIREDTELQRWWYEVRFVGHGDLKDEPWWPTMCTREELIQSCTIIIWVSSALHAAVNFGQYPYGGYLPNWPTMSRRLLPEPGTPDYDELESDPEKAFLKTMTPQIQGMVGISLFEILSRHSADEVYLGERDTPEWTADKQALEAFERFGENLRRIERKIDEMNRDDKLINRTGPAQMPYTLLYPSSDVGLTGRGIPNSASI